MRKTARIDFRLYLITDRTIPESAQRFIPALKAALQGGVSAVQLREKDLGTKSLMRLAYRVRELTRQYGALFFINDRFDVALAVGADGVHLTQGSIPAATVRRTVRKKLLVGVSTHSLKEALSAERADADFITFGPVYRTPSKQRYGSPLGLEMLRKVCARVKLPVFAIGGMKGGRTKAALKRGASGVAMISEVFGARDIRSKTAEILNILESS